MIRLCGCIAVVTAMLACGEVKNSGNDAATTGSDARVVVVDANLVDGPVRPPGAVDILFVIDDSTGMAEEQVALVQSFSSFLATLETASGGLPSLHVGVVSTDVGAGPYSLPNCTGNGDNGVLQSAAVGGMCSGPNDAFIKDEVDVTGSRITNYSGTLPDTFSCIAQLGVQGCAFEQPLESMRRALNGSNPSNAGFLRDSATLAVIVVSDEDDCSTSNTAMFNPDDSTLGPVSSYRCFQYGVVCNPDDPQTPGDKTGCQPRSDSPYMYPIQGYVDFLLGLKGNVPVVVGTITAPAAPVSVALDPAAGMLDLQPACNSSAGEADPAVRLHAFADGFGGNSSTATICDNSFVSALNNIASKIAAVR